MSFDEIPNNIARHPAQKHASRPTIDSAYTLETISEETAYSSIAFWPACRLTDIWRKESAPGDLARATIISPKHVGGTILPHITLFEKSATGLSQNFPANDGRFDGAPETVLSIRGHLHDAIRMTHRTHTPSFLKLISRNRAEHDFAGVILPMRAPYLPFLKSDQAHQAEPAPLQYCCCLAPI